jgi:DNA invertase Pin-like site-specific DNA recombinase
MKVGYIRISTEAQNMFRQEDLMAELGVEKVFEDRASGKNTDRPGLKEMLGFVRHGDQVVVESISRLARSTSDLLNIVTSLENRGVNFVSKKEALDTQTPQGRFVLTIFAGLASLERETILQRTKEGIESARARGKHLGRPVIEIPKDWDAIHSQWKDGKLTAVQAMKILGLTKTTFYKMASR